MKPIYFISFLFILSCQDEVSFEDLEMNHESSKKGKEVSESLYADKNGNTYYKVNGSWSTVPQLIELNVFHLAFIQWGAELDSNRYQVFYYDGCPVTIPFARLHTKSTNYVLKEHGKTKMFIRLLKGNYAWLIDYLKEIHQNKHYDYKEVLQEIHGIGQLDSINYILFQVAPDLHQTDPKLLKRTLKTFNIKRLPPLN